jgi:26S proteasome regulatory subunit N1
LQTDEQPVDDLMDLVKQIVPFHVKHNAEPEAVDLLMEVENLELLTQHIDKGNYKRTCSYLTSFASYVPEPDDTLVLDIAYQLYCKFEKYPDALRVALRMDNTQYVKSTFAACKDLLEKQQLCYILARQVDLCPQPLLSCGIFQPSTWQVVWFMKEGCCPRMLQWPSL